MASHDLKPTQFAQKLELLRSPQGSAEYRLAHSLALWLQFADGHRNELAYQFSGKHGVTVYSAVHRSGLCPWVGLSTSEDGVGLMNNPAYALLGNLLQRDYADVPTYPFGGSTVYNKEYETHTAHKNFRRRQWATQAAGKLFYLDFLNRWLEASNKFLTTGECSEQPALRHYGLCMGVYLLCDDDSRPFANTQLKRALFQQFGPVQNGYPFGGRVAYNAESVEGKSLANEERRAWVTLEIKRVSEETVMKDWP